MTIGRLAPLYQSPAAAWPLDSTQLLAAEIPAGEPAGIRVEPATLMFHDPARLLPLPTASAARDVRSRRGT